LLGRHSTTWVMPPALFTLVILDVVLAFCSGWPGPWFSYFTVPAITGMTEVCSTMLSFLLLSWDLANFFAQADWESWSSWSQPATQLGRCIPWWLRWGLVNYFPRLVSNHNSPDLSFQVARITAMSNQHLVTFFNIYINP
jgi:hypothetical protein